MLSDCTLCVDCVWTAERNAQLMESIERELAEMIKNSDNDLDKSVKYEVEMLLVLDYAVYKMWVTCYNTHTQSQIFTAPEFLF